MSMTHRPDRGYVPRRSGFAHGPVVESSEAPSNWYDPIVAILTGGGAAGYLWLHETGIADAVGQPVSAWADTSGAAIWEQPGVSSLRPIRQTDRVAFDGIDDRLNGPAEVSSVLSGATWSMGLGARSLTPSGARAFWSITDGSTANLMTLTTADRLAFVPAAALFAASTDAGPMSVWATRANADFVRRLSAVESVGTNASYPVGLNLPTLGARRAPSAALFHSGGLSWVALTTRTLSSADMLAIEDILVANGYPI